MVWLLLVAADAPSDDESLCDARPENGQHWGGVTGRKIRRSHYDRTIGNSYSYRVACGQSKLSNVTSILVSQGKPSEDMSSFITSVPSTSAI
ncbi:Uncharacterized protein BM_BM10308 [Brugia malayi]|uniref:Uncharacterized protein n=2 Tax=Brugia TaxID=6278 RepID=A0A4E9EZK1_BRUMA|nr:Uncharacterized protein BM_BM10308 [Brugia malayi]VIO89207.1 Uncharacterized protein BM_BM10308 [Brugia malayi]